mmetsp:Transcript_46617/g.139183  ORF Transcript_46617/g.139183 Transcript_46617/m.139183 type:complete len:317 (+) Transcript_46617:674-1624(+)
MHANELVGCNHSPVGHCSKGTLAVHCDAHDADFNPGRSEACRHAICQGPLPPAAGEEGRGVPHRQRQRARDDAHGGITGLWRRPPSVRAGCGPSCCGSRSRAVDRPGCGRDPRRRRRRLRAEGNNLGGGRLHNVKHVTGSAAHIARALRACHLLLDGSLQAPGQRRRRRAHQGSDDGLRACRRPGQGDRVVRPDRADAQPEPPATRAWHCRRAGIGCPPEGGGDPLARDGSDFRDHPPHREPHNRVAHELVGEAVGHIDLERARDGGPLHKGNGTACADLRGGLCSPLCVRCRLCGGGGRVCKSRVIGIAQLRVRG